jgi:hypothetical protein
VALADAKQAFYGFPDTKLSMTAVATTRLLARVGPTTPTRAGRSYTLTPTAVVALVGSISNQRFVDRRLDGGAVSRFRTSEVKKLDKEIKVKHHHAAKRLFTLGARGIWIAAGWRKPVRCCRDAVIR